MGSRTVSFSTCFLRPFPLGLICKLHKNSDSLRWPSTAVKQNKKALASGTRKPPFNTHDRRVSPAFLTKSDSRCQASTDRLRLPERDSYTLTLRPRTFFILRSPPASVWPFCAASHSVASSVIKLSTSRLLPQRLLSTFAHHRSVPAPKCRRLGGQNALRGAGALFYERVPARRGRWF